MSTNKPLFFCNATAIMYVLGARKLTFQVDKLSRIFVALDVSIGSLEASVLRPE